MKRYGVSIAVAFAVTAVLGLGGVWGAGPVSGSGSGELRPPAAAAPTPSGRGVSEGTQWNTDLNYALARAGRVGKPVLVMFSASWAPPCQAMKREVLTRPDVVAMLRSVEAVEIDVDAQPEVSGSFRVDQLPVFAVLNGDGVEYDRFSGFLPERAFLETLESALDPRLAIGELERHVAREPKDMKAWWQLARKYARDRNQPRLEATLNRMRELDPRNRRGYLDRVSYLELMTTLDIQKPGDGYRAAGLFLREFPESGYADEVEMARAQLAWQMGERAEALKILRGFGGKYPRSPLARQVARDLQDMERAMRER